MTFDEAIEKIESITDELNIRQEIINDIVSVVEGLREEYAPTVEMTKKQRVNFLNAKKSGKNFYDLWGHYKLNSNNSLGHYSEFQLMQAWLHPETIKLVDE